jgi:hypothetical protein
MSRTYRFGVSEVDDDTSSSSKTWSSNKIQVELGQRIGHATSVSAVTASGATYDIDYNNGTVQFIDISADTEFNMVNYPSGMHVSGIMIYFDPLDHVITFNSSIDIAGNGVTIVANTVNRVLLEVVPMTSSTFKILATVIGTV